MTASDADKRIREICQEYTMPCPCCGGAVMMAYSSNRGVNKEDIRALNRLIASKVLHLIATEDAEQQGRERPQDFTLL